jgi:quinone-modifying oxidoreductase, subunit QmoC
VDKAEASSQATMEAEARASPQRKSPDSGGPPLRIEPDLEFIRELGGCIEGSFKQCMQCGTCSATCELSPDEDPFPRKEVIWAAWGMKDRLMGDPDIWLCYQCHDCSERCPRGARPGDVLAAVRRECVIEHAVPGAFGRLVNHPRYLPLLLGIPAALLVLAMLIRVPLQTMLGFEPTAGEQIIYSFSSMLPHWLINIFFGFFTLLTVVLTALGLRRYWKRLKSGPMGSRAESPVRSLPASFLAVMKGVFSHRDFGKCTREKPRFWSHLFVVYGFAALTIVTVWIITLRLNPLITETFVYPYGFLHPFKLLANLGAAAILAGCAMMSWDRLKDPENARHSTYFDWSLIATIVLVVVTGLITEALHFTRLEPHRHIAYFVHLVFVLGLILYLPYSKLAHLAYRVTAQVFAAHIGRDRKAEADGEEKKDVA